MIEGLGCTGEVCNTHQTWTTEGHGECGKVTCITAQTHSGLRCWRTTTEGKVLATRGSQYKPQQSIQPAKALPAQDDEGGSRGTSGAARICRG